MHLFNKYSLVSIFLSGNLWLQAQSIPPILTNPQQIQGIFTTIMRADQRASNPRPDTVTSGTGSADKRTAVAQLSTQELQWLDQSNKIHYTRQRQSPMFTGLYAPFKVFPAAPNRPTIMQFKNGSKIEIPKEAFMDEAGNAVLGNVEIHYCEYKEAADQLLSGIRMRDMQTNILLEATGTFEIKMLQNGKPVFLRPNKTIRVQVASFKEEANFDFWQYVPESGQWKEIDGDGQIPARANENYVKTDSSSNTLQTFPKVVRHFYIQQAGIFTWGRMRTTQQLFNISSEAKLNFDQRAGISNPNDAAYFLLIDNGKAVLPLTYYEAQHFSFVNTADVLLAVLPNQKIASFKGEYWKELMAIILSGNNGGQALAYDFDTEAQNIDSADIFKTTLYRLTH